MARHRAAETAGTPKNNAADRFFLPNFTSGEAVLPVVLIAELLAFVLATAGYGFNHLFWVNLGLISLFIQWVALTSLGVLCLSRRLLTNQSALVAIMVSYLLLLATTAALSECAYQIVHVTNIAPNTIDASHIVFMGRNLIVSAIINALALRYFYINNQWKKNLERDVQSRIEALQARIRPHFLFNSLNTIAALIGPKPDIAEQAIEDLADLFRASLGATGTVVLLADEIALTREYERIEKLRLGDRLDVDWHVDELPADARVPQLMLQPVLENAIYHGIEPRGDGGVISVLGYREDDDIIIEVINPLAPKSSPRRRGNHMALNNVRERLQLLYGAKTRVDARTYNNYFRLVLRFPCRMTEKS